MNTPARAATGTLPWSRWIEHGSTYALMLLLLFGLQAGATFVVGFYLMQESWWLYDCLIPWRLVPRLLGDGDQRIYGAILLAAALLVYGLGFRCTVRRLRVLQAPAWPAIFLFVPLINVFLVSILSVLGPDAPPEDRRNEPAAPLLPLETAVSCEAPPTALPYADAYRAKLPPPAPAFTWAAAAIVLPAVGGTAFTALGTRAIALYGWSLFVGVPFAIGFCSVLLYRLLRPGNIFGAALISTLALTTWGFALLLTGFEGVACLAMAAPVVLGAGFIGALMAQSLQSIVRRGGAVRLLPLMMCLVPALMGAERLVDAQAPLLCVRSSVDIDAPPEVVWRNVIDFPQLPEPREWYFRAGIAYPICAKIDGCGAGAVRECIFNTGAFVEPIEVWDEPRLLSFRVTDQPAPMREWTFYGHIHPPHLDGFLTARRGQFRLLPLAEGRTRLEGTTWYQHHMWPVGYWQLWSDFLIHRIHLRVLEHVKTHAETDRPGPLTRAGAAGHPGSPSTDRTSKP